MARINGFQMSGLIDTTAQALEQMYLVALENWGEDPTDEELKPTFDVDLDQLVAGINRLVNRMKKMSGEGAMGPKTEAPSKSQAEMVDALREVVEAVEEVFNGKQLHLPPKKKAELITLLCEEIGGGE